VSDSKQKKEEQLNKANEETRKTEETEIVKKYKEDVDKYVHLKRKKLMSQKESKTLELLNSFRERLFTAKQQAENVETVEAETETAEKNPDSLYSILTHKLEVDEEIQQKVKDANILDNERYSIYDPRNTLNKRKREASKEVIRDRKRH
jgi:peptidyl-prolyl cis-trans isomerase SDCCAG10